MSNSETEKVEAAVKSIEEFEAMLNGIRQQGWDEGYAAGLAAHKAEKYDN